MKRRDLIRYAGAVTATTAAAGTTRAFSRAGAQGPWDTLVVGAGVFGVWTAAHLHRLGQRVALVEAASPAHSAASSGGESRVTRCGYGSDALYSEWSDRSQREWAALSQRAAVPLFHPMGVLWVHARDDADAEASVGVLARQRIPFLRLSATSLRSRYPVMRVGDDEAGLLEPRSGALMARRAVQQLALELAAAGVPTLREQVLAIRSDDGEAGTLPALRTVGGNTLRADQYVFACGPWLDRVCPDAMQGRLFVTRQEVVYFRAPAGATGELPVWAALPFYGFPDLEGRGFKVANDTHGEAVTDVDGVDRQVRPATVTEARAFLAERFPALADAPVSETRVCQYENSSNGDLLVDRHPGLDNVWLAGCGSGHGFKHGPALGEHMAARVTGRTGPIERLLLAGKEKRQQRAVH